MAVTAGADFDPMLYRLAADLLLILHLAFIVFVVVGGWFVWRWPRLAWIHAPVALWGAAIEFGGFLCPLTPLEQRWRALAGQAGYTGGFIEHYLMPVIYPGALTRELQLWLGGVVVALNIAAYAWAIHRRQRRIGW